MKKLFLFVIVAATGSVLISSCKKSDPVSIVGKWNLVNQISCSSGVCDTLPPTAGDYAEFTSGGLLISGNNNVPTDTINYSVSNSNLYISYPSAGSDTFHINTLTNSSLQLFRDYGTSTATIDFSR